MKNKNVQEDMKMLDVYLEEYKHVSASILGSEDGRRQTVNTIVAVVAASVSAVNIFQSQPILYLFGSLLLSLLTWIMIEETARTGIHNRYLRLVLGPKIQNLLKGFSSHPLQYTEFAFDVNPSTTAATVLAPAKYLIGLGISGLLMILFFAERGMVRANWNLYETILVYANVFSFAFPVVFGLFNIVALSLREILKSFKKNAGKVNDVNELPRANGKKLPKQKRIKQGG